MLYKVILTSGTMNSYAVSSCFLVLYFFLLAPLSNKHHTVSNSNQNKHISTHLDYNEYGTNKETMKQWE